MRTRRSPSSIFCLTFLSACFVTVGVLAAGPAAAVTVSILGVSSSAGSAGLAVGDTLSLDIGLRNTDDPVYAVGISIYGYDRDILELVDVTTSSSFLNRTDPAAGPGGGFVNAARQDDYSHLPVGIQEIILADVEPRVRLFQGISLSLNGGDGSMDRGIAGGLTGEGDAHARVTFRLISAAATTLSIGTDLMQDAVLLSGVVLASAKGTSYAVYPGLGSSGPWVPTPEPGTALLVGLGLAVLSGRRSRR